MTILRAPELHESIGQLNAEGRQTRHPLIRACSALISAAASLGSQRELSKMLCFSWTCRCRRRRPAADSQSDRGVRRYRSSRSW